MNRLKKSADLVAVGLAVLIILGAVFTAPWWAWGTSDYTDDLGQEMPEQGDVGWDDAVRLNSKILEVSFIPVLEGHYVVEEPAISGTTTVITWGPGWVYMNDGTGVSKYLPGGTTTIQSNTLSWLSAVTPGAAANQVTMQVRSGEYDIPTSGGSGFYHVPLAAIVTEAGNVVRHKSLTFMAPWKYPITQPLDSGATPTFTGIKATNQVNTKDLDASGGVTLPRKPNTTRTTAGSVEFNTTNKWLALGDGTYTRAIPTEENFEIPIEKPFSMAEVDNVPLFTVGGTTFWFTGATLWASESGVSIEGLAYSSTQTNFLYSTGVNIIGSLTATTAGTSVWTASISGATAIPPRRTVLMNYGVAAPNRIKLSISGWYEGNKP